MGESVESYICHIVARYKSREKSIGNRNNMRKLNCSNEKVFNKQHEPAPDQTSLYSMPEDLKTQLHLRRIEERSGMHNSAAGSMKPKLTPIE